MNQEKHVVREVIEDPGVRWEQDIDHHPKTVELYQFIEDLDFKYGDTFCFKSGGDGDNGEQLMFLMDAYFERRELEENGAIERQIVLQWVNQKDNSQGTVHLSIDSTYRQMTETMEKLAEERQTQLAYMMVRPVWKHQTFRFTNDYSTGVDV